MHHYDYVELKDFSAGMWTSQDWQVPANGAKLLEDCYPLPQGGLRAFGKFTTLPNGGIGNGEQPDVMWAEDHVGGSDYYLLTSDSSFVCRLYRMDESDGATTWTLIKTFAAGGDRGMSFMTSFQLVGQPRPDIYLALNSTGSDKGLWRIRTNGSGGTATVTRPTIVTTEVAVADFTGPLTVHQNSLVLSQEESKIWFTEQGSETILDLSYVNVGPSYRLTTNAFLRPFPPDDLLVAKRGAPWTFIQAELSNPIERTMGDVRHASVRQIPAELDEGIAFQAVLDGIYTTPDGARFQKISDAISVGDLWGTVGSELASFCGSMGYLDNWLFHPSGHIYDTRTKAWFRTSYWSQSQSAFAIYVNKHRSQHRVVAVQEPPDVNSPPILHTLRPYESGMSRVRSYRYISPDLHDDSGRQIEMGEVHVVLKSYGNGASLTVATNGVTRVVSNINSGRQIVPVMFRERGSTLDIEVEPDSGSVGIEAPSIEAIRVGVLKGHLLRTTT